MENKARYTIVGLFLIIFTAALVSFVLWQARFSLNEKQMYEYRIYSQNSIAGLKENSFVEYKGLVIGTVDKILINPDNIEQIQIVLKIHQPDVIKKDSFAVIQSQGITGNKNIEIDGGSIKSPSIIPQENGFSVIPLRDSFFDSITKDAGDITQNFNKVLVNVNALLDKKNINNFTSVLADLKESSQNLPATLKKLDTTLVTLNSVLQNEITGTLHSVDTTAKEWGQLSKDLQRLVNNDIKILTGKVNGTLDDTKGLDRVIYNINSTLEKLGVTLDNFNTNGGDILFKTRDVRYGPKESLND